MQVPPAIIRLGTIPILPLDLARPCLDTGRMKSLLCLLAVVFCLARADAANLYLDGTLSYNVTEPQCEFRLKGKLQNLSAEGTGTLKLVLWATKELYPSPGYIVGEITLPALGGGLQFNDFTVKTKSDVPFENGTFYFTIAVVEFTAAGWRNQLLEPTGSRILVNGNFANQQQWAIPDTEVIPPPLPLAINDKIKLTQRATDELNAFPSGWRDKTNLTIKNGTELSYDYKSRTEKVSYTYSVVKTKMKGMSKKVWAGKLVMTTERNNQVTFKNTITLYYQGNKKGTYKSSVKGYLFDGELGKSVTWGKFKLKPAF